MRRTERKEHVITNVRVEEWEVVQCDRCGTPAAMVQGYDVTEDKARPVPEIKGWVVGTMYPEAHGMAHERIFEVCPACSKFVAGFVFQATHPSK